MLTDGFYTALAAALREQGESGSGLFVAVGSGRAAWDQAGPPPVTRAVEKLTAEVARKQVPAGGAVYLDGAGDESGTPMPRLRVSVAFAPGEATGTLRECGLFAGTAAGGDATLLSYFAHPRIDKEAGMELVRRFVIDLTPHALAAGQVETRFLANTRDLELHDLENVTPNCQADEIRFDRRFFFHSVQEALDAGYDRCAYCFGRALSQR